MPAVDLARLQKQLDDLEQMVAAPIAFHQQLNELLGFYANHAYRPGMEVQSQPLMPVYRLPPVVIRHLKARLVRIARADNDRARTLADELWQDAYLETRALAALLVGQLPPGEFMLERLREWCTPGLERQLLTEVLACAGQRLRRENAAVWLAQIEEWLKFSQAKVQAIGLRAVTVSVIDEAFDDMPALYAALEPFLQNPPGELQSDLVQLLEALAERSPAETGFLLKQILLLHQNPRNARLIRQVLSKLPPQIQQTLRAALK